MKDDNSGNDSSSSRRWKQMRLDVALKTEVFALYRQRSDAECRALAMRVKPVKP